MDKWKDGLGKKERMWLFFQTDIISKQQPNIREPIKFAVRLFKQVYFMQHLGSVWYTVTPGPMH